MTDQRDPAAHRLSLREPTFLILLSLASGQRHGYAILKDVETLSQRQVKLSTGTLYEALARLLEQDLIERLEDEDLPAKETPAAASHRGKPRKAYRLTRKGRRALEAEMRRMQALVSAAQRRLRNENV